MPPAFNLSQDQTLQFNLCFVPSLAGSALTRKPSLTQNTDSCVLANLSVFLLREHLLLYNLSIPANRRTPSSAHTYRLLVVKELQNGKALCLPLSCEFFAAPACCCVAASARRRIIERLFTACKPKSSVFFKKFSRLVYSIRKPIRRC